MWTSDKCDLKRFLRIAFYKSFEEKWFDIAKRSPVQRKTDRGLHSDHKIASHNSNWVRIRVNVVSETPLGAIRLFISLFVFCFTHRILTLPSLCCYSLNSSHPHHIYPPFFLVVMLLTCPKLQVARHLAYDSLLSALLKKKKKKTKVSKYCRICLFQEFEL